MGTDAAGAGASGGTMAVREGAAVLRGSDSEATVSLSAWFRCVDESVETDSLGALSGAFDVCGRGRLQAERVAIRRIVAVSHTSFLTVLVYQKSGLGVKCLHRS